MRYFFHVRDGETLIEDPDGSEHASLDEACNEAIQSAREIMAANLIAGQPLEPPWVCRRLQLLRDWSHDEENTAF